VRLQLEKGAKVVFSARYDSSGDFEPLCTVFGTTLRSFTVPLRPKRCDHMQLRVEGEGMGKIYSITSHIRQSGA